MARSLVFLIPMEPVMKMLLSLVAVAAFACTFSLAGCECDKCQTCETKDKAGVCPHCGKSADQCVCPKK